MRKVHHIITTHMKSYLDLELRMREPSEIDLHSPSIENAPGMR